MFYWFLKDYETNIFKADDRKLKSLYNWEKLLLLLYITSCIAWFISFVTQPGGVLFVIFLIIFIITAIIISLLEKNRRKKRNQ